MKSYKKAYFFALLIMSCFATNEGVAEGLYIRPRAGMAIPIDGSDSYYSVGGSLGYQWISLFATEVTYLRLLTNDAAPDGSSIRAQGIFSLPVGIIRPYASLGVGRFHIDAPGSDAQISTIFGGGIALAKIAFLSAAVGVEYAVVPNVTDYVEPYITIGLSF